MQRTCRGTSVLHARGFLQRRSVFAFVRLVTGCVLACLFGCVEPAAAAVESQTPDPVAAKGLVPGDLNGDGVARVVAVGDSIMEGAAPQIEEAFRSAGYEVAVDTAVSRSTLAGVDLVRFYTAMGADAVVVMLGANDAGNAETFRNRVRSVVDAAQGAPLLMWMTIPEVRDYYPAANEVLRQEMWARVGGSVLDWSPVAASVGVTAGDGLHLTPAGIETMTEFLVPSVVASIENAQVGASGSGSGSESGDGDTADGREPSHGEQNNNRDGRTVARHVDSIDPHLGPDRLAIAGVLVAAVLVCGGLGVALWSLSRTGGRTNET